MLETFAISPRGVHKLRDVSHKIPFNLCRHSHHNPNVGKDETEKKNANFAAPATFFTSSPKLPRSCDFDRKRPWSFAQFERKIVTDTLEVSFSNPILCRNAMKSEDFHSFLFYISSFFIYLFLIQFTWGGLLNAFTQFRYHYHPFFVTHTKPLRNQ